MKPIRNNQTKPNQTQTTPSGAGGVSRSRVQVGPVASGFGEDLEPFVERRAREFEWVRRHLPDENEGMAVSALLSIQTFGDRPTRKSVLARLRAQGRTVEQMREKGWLE